MSNCPKILVLFSAPLVKPDGNPFHALDITAERKALIDEFLKSKIELRVRFDFATIEALAQGIKDGFNIIHFSGHGNEQFLAFEDGQGGCHPVDGPFLKRLIGTASPFELAVVSACQSEAIGGMINNAGVRHVVAIKRKTPVLDIAATKFVGAFYSYLLNSDTIQKSFEMAKLLVEGDPGLARIKPILEAQNDISGKRFITEENKFVLIPSNKSSFHHSPISSNLTSGSLFIDEQVRTPNNIPVKSASFLGRSKEIHNIVNLLNINRLVTITGVGGIGKTAISMEIARWFYLRNKFNDGIFVVNARDSKNSNRIIDLLGACFEKQFFNVQDVIKFISSLNMLIVLDNLEDLLWADEENTQKVINELLKYTPSLHILITSQRQLGGNLHEAEHVFRLGMMSDVDSIELFKSTSKRELSEQECRSTDLNVLMRQLGGHPLSLVIMAKQLAYGINIAELNQRIKAEKAKAIVIKGISDKQPEHGESLIASLLSSYNNLNDSSKQIFTCLSMLPAGAPKKIVEDIFGKGSWEIIHRLADTSLVEIEGSRVTLLAPVQLFSTSFLKDKDKLGFGPKIVRLMANLAFELHNGLQTDKALMIRAIFAIEEPNLRGAIELPPVFDRIANQKEVSDTGTLIHFLMALYELSYRKEEAIALGKFMIPILEQIGDRRGLARVLHQLGSVNRSVRNYQESKKYLKKSLKLFKHLGAKDGELNSLVALGSVLIKLKDFDVAEETLNEAINKAKQSDNFGIETEIAKNAEANAYRQLSRIKLIRKDYKKAQFYLEKSLKIFKVINQKFNEVGSFFDLGRIYSITKDYPKAKNNLEQAVKLARNMGIKNTEANALFMLAQIYIEEGDKAQAKVSIENALKIYKELGDEKLSALATTMLSEATKIKENN